MAYTATLTEKSTCSCPTTSEDSIRQKIQTANVLIHKVREALQSIKTKKYEPRKRVTSDTTDTEIEPITSEIEDEDSRRNKLDPNQCMPVTQSPAEFERPKTRRGGYDDNYVAEKFRTEPKNLIAVHDSELEVLKSKLHVISESTESEEPKETKNTTEKSTGTEIVQSSADDTFPEPILKDVKATQTQTETAIIGTQISISTVNQDVQTHCAGLKTCSCCDGPTDNFKKSTKVLELQILPQINIPSGLVVQRVIEFSINQNGDTELFYKSEKSNVLFVEVTPSEDSIMAIGNFDTGGFDQTPTVVNVKELIEGMTKFGDSDILSKYVATSQDNFIDVPFDSRPAEETTDSVDQTPSVENVRELIEGMTKFMDSDNVSKYVATSRENGIDITFDGNSVEETRDSVDQTPSVENVRELIEGMTKFMDSDNVSKYVATSRENGFDITFDGNSVKETRDTVDETPSVVNVRELLEGRTLFMDSDDVSKYVATSRENLIDVPFDSHPTEETTEIVDQTPSAVNVRELDMDSDSVSKYVATSRENGIDITFDGNPAEETSKQNQQEKSNIKDARSSCKVFKKVRNRIKIQDDNDYQYPKSLPNRKRKFLFSDTFDGPDTENDTLIRLSDAPTKLTLTIDQKEYIFKFTGAVEVQKPVTKTKEHFLKNIGHYVAICRSGYKVYSSGGNDKLLHPSIHLFTGSQSVTKEMILRSYHIYDNADRHGPGSFPAWDLVSDIDESVYKTFINPEGIRTKEPTVTDLPVIRHTGPSHREDREPETEKQKKMEPEEQHLEHEKQQKIESEDQQKAEEEPRSPRVYNIGLYKSKETQFQPYPEAFKMEEYSSDSFEKISFSLTVSTDTSASTSISDISSDEVVEGRGDKTPLPARRGSHAVLRHLKEKMVQQCPEDTWSISIYDNLSNESFQKEVSVPDFIGDLMSRSTEKLEKVIPKIRKSVRRTSIYIANKRRSPMANLLIADSTESDEEEPEKHANSKAVTDTLIMKTPQEQINTDAFNCQIEKKNNMSLQGEDDTTNRVTKRENKLKPVSFTSTKDNDSCDSFEKNNKNSTVMTVHVHGDFLPVTKADRFINALEVSKNGRYKDEENLFCENAYQKYPTPNTPNEINNSDKVNLLDVSSSDILTSKSFSKGEVKCKCSVSSGELHVCKDSCKEPQQRRNVSPKKKTKERASKRKTYFNNWVTYYVKNDQDINDSS